MSYKTLKKWLIWERRQDKKMGCLTSRPNPDCSRSDMAASSLQEVEDVPVILLPCGICGRTFRPEVLSKHGSVCQRQHTKKRKKFDSAKQRIQGTDLAEFLGPPPLVSKPKPPSPKKSESKWKEKHEALVRSLRDERRRPNDGKKTTELSKPSDHSQCPHCDRYFGPKAFDRHTAWCREQHSKIQLQNQDVSKAKMRLEARIKYRAPCFKSQRSVTKEKYLPAGSVTRPPISSNSSTLPPATNFPPPTLRRNTSSLSATEVGVKSGTSPALTRRNSVPRQQAKQKSKGDENLELSAKKPQHPTALPTLLNTSTTNRAPASSWSSEGNDWRWSGNKSGSNTVGESCNRGGGSKNDAMGSSPPPLDQPKPVIKSSYSTNRKVKKDEMGSETKRWKRRQEGLERNSTQTTLPIINSTDGGGTASNKVVINQNCDKGDKPRKGWARVKPQNWHPLMINSKSKKSKTKSKKSKPLSPVKSSSSQKTIILSDRENELDRLKKLNRLCEEEKSFQLENCRSKKKNISNCDIGECKNQSSCDDIYHDGVITKDEGNYSDNDDCQGDTISSQTVINLSKGYNSTNPCQKSDPDIFKENQAFTGCELISSASSHEDVSKVSDLQDPVCWVISFTSPDDSQSDRDNEGNNQNDNICNEEVNVSCFQSSETCVISEECNSYNIEAFTNVKSEVSIPNENCHPAHLIINNLIPSSIDPPPNESNDSLTFANTLKSNENFENTKQISEGPEKKVSIESNNDISDFSNKLSLNLKSFVVQESDCLLSKNLTVSDNTSKSDSLKNEVHCTNESIINCNKGINILMNKIKERLESSCECQEIIDCIRHSLDLLLDSRCLVHGPSLPRPSKPWEWNGSKFGQDKMNQINNLNVSNLNKVKSYSDSKLNYCRQGGCFEKKFSGSRLLNNYYHGRAQKKSVHESVNFSQDPRRSVHLINASCQTQLTGILIRSPPESETRTVTDERARETCPFYNNLEHSQPRQRDNGVVLMKNRSGSQSCMGDRLRDVRRLLSRNCDTNDNLDCSTMDEEEAGSNTSSGIDTLSLVDHQNFERNRNNQVVLTSVQRLYNPRELVNRQLALREQRLVSKASSHHRGAMSLVIDTMSSGDSLPHSSSLRLPPLAKSTLKRLNRRWSPGGDGGSGEYGMTEGTHSEEDGAIGRFCHECGGRYPVPGAKFCCLCGVRRLAV